MTSKPLTIVSPLSCTDRAFAESRQLNKPKQKLSIPSVEHQQEIFGPPDLSCVCQLLITA